MENNKTDETAQNAEIEAQGTTKVEPEAKTDKPIFGEEYKDANVALPDHIFQTMLEDTAKVVFANLKVDRDTYPAIATFVNQELEKILRESTSLSRVHKICGGNMDTSYLYKTTTEHNRVAAIKITDTLCYRYSLNLKNNGGLHVFYTRIARYFTGMITTKFSQKWLGRKLCNI